MTPSHEAMLIAYNQIRQHEDLEEAVTLAGGKLQ